MGASLGVSFVIGAKLASTVSSAFASVQSKLKATQAAFSAANRKTRMLDGVVAARNRLDSLAAKMRAEGATPKDLANMQKLAEAYAKAAKNAGVYGQSLAQIVRQQREAAQEAARAERSLAALNRVQKGRDIRSEQSQFRKTAISSAIADIAPLGVMFSPLRIGADFDAAMSRVGAISQASAEDLENLRKKARELGASTVWSAKEAADGMTFLSMAGFKASETMAAMPGMLSLASAGAMDLAATSDIASNILSGFGMQASQMNYVADVMARTFTSSNTSIASIGESMKYAAPAAVMAGQSFQDVAAMVGKLGDAGIQGSMAGTALNAMMIRLAKQPKEAETALRLLNISVKDSVGNMRALPDIMAEIEAKTRKMGGVAKADIFGRIFGLENAKSGAVLAKQAFSGELQKLSASLNEKDFAQKVAVQQNDNLIGDLRSLNSVYEDVGITLFEVLNPALRKITRGIIPLVQGVGQWINANPRLVQGLTLLAGAFIGLKIAGLGLTLINSYGKTLAGGLISMQGQALRPIAAVRNGLSQLSAQLSRPVGNPFATARQGAASLKIRLDSLRSALLQTGARLTQITPASIAAGAAARMSGMAAAAGRVGWNSLRLGIRGVGMAFRTMFGPMNLLIMGLTLGVEQIMEHWDEIQPYFEALWDGVKNVFNAVLAWLKPIIDKISGFIGPVIDKISAVGEFVGASWDALFGNDKEKERKERQKAEAEKRKQATALDPEFEENLQAIQVKTPAQMQQEEQWAEQYSGLDYKEALEKEKLEKKAAKEKEKQEKKAARERERQAKRAAREAEKAKGKKSGKKQETIPVAVPEEPSFPLPSQYGEAYPEAEMPQAAPIPEQASPGKAPARKPGASRKPVSQPITAMGGAPETQIVQPQIQVQLQITQNGIPDAEFASGVMNAIRSRQAELERMISAIVNEQARLAYG